MRISKAGVWYRSSVANPPSSKTRFIIAGEHLEAFGMAADLGLSLTEWLRIALPHEEALLQVFELMPEQPAVETTRRPSAHAPEGSGASMEHPPTATTRFIFVGPFWEASRTAAQMDLALRDWIFIETTRPLQVFERAITSASSALREPPSARVQAKAAQMRVAADRKAHRETPERIRKLAEWREPELPGDDG